MYKLVFTNEKGQLHSKTIVLWESVVNYIKHLEEKGYSYIVFIKQNEKWILIKGEGHDITHDERGS